MTTHAPVIAARDVGKRFRVGAPRTTKDRLLHPHDRQGTAIDALRDVTLEIGPGEAVGVVGPNGAGKSTLLRLIAGVLVADAGEVRVGGNVGSLLDLGAGFHPDLTGRESALLNALIGGRSRRDARRRLDAVSEFAGLGEWFDRPLRTYSSGMQARLAFAIATDERPDVLLVDEVLAVGDVAFQQRCIERIRSFRTAGTTLVLVSHDPDLVRSLCERAVWLEAGRVVVDGDVDDVLDRYLGGAPLSSTPVTDAAARLGAVRVLDDRGRPCRALHVGASLVVEVDFVVPSGDGDEQLRVSVKCVRDDDLVCVDTSTAVPAAPGSVSLRFERLDLAPGGYRIEVGLFDATWGRTLDVRGVAARFRVLGTASASAALAPPATWTVGPAERLRQGPGPRTTAGADRAPSSTPRRGT